MNHLKVEDDCITVIDEHTLMEQVAFDYYMKNVRVNRQGADKAE